LGSARRVAAAERREVLALVARTRRRTGWTVRRILRRLGLPKTRYYAWRAWEEEANRTVLETLGRQPAWCPWAILPEEREAVVGYALGHPRAGYRRLAWMMVDAEVAYVSPSSVYRILDDADLLYRWKRSERVGERPPEPTRPNQRWHTDLMYLRVGDVWYFLVSVLDAYSRYVVHWDLLTSMTAADVRVVLQDALKRTGATPEVVTDNGSQFTAKDFKELVREFAVEHIRIRTYHPESNGKVERFHRSTREALSESELGNLSRAREIIARWVRHYNEERLHASLQYLPPAEYYAGDPAARIAERTSKLAEARQRRETINRQQFLAAA
jgi:transposase InsO family protein